MTPMNTTAPHGHTPTPHHAAAPAPLRERQDTHDDPLRDAELARMADDGAKTADVP